MGPLIYSVDYGTTVVHAVHHWPKCHYVAHAYNRGYRLDDPGEQFPAWKRESSILQNVQTDSAAHSASFSTCIVILSQGVEQLKC